jgi:hypothetical protein
MAKETENLKSAYELAMERLEAEDKAEGRKPKPLSKDQKAKIGELRTEARAKLAELEILHRDQLTELQSHPEREAELKELDEHYEIDRRRVDSELESKIERIKNG